MKVLDDELGYANIIVLALDGATPRFTSGLQNMLRQMSAIFGQSWWDYMMIGVTKWPYDQDSIDDRQQDCDDFGEDSDFCKNEANFIKQWTRQLNEKFELDQNYTFAFMDSYSQSGNSNIQDEIQQIHWKEETSKLWDEATKRNKTMEFKTIDEVLEENQICKEENERLHDIIDEEIATIKEDIKTVKTDVSHNADDISAQGSTMDMIKEDISHNADEISALASNVALNSKHIQENSDGIEAVESKVSENENDIELNSVDIASNSADILANSAKIETNNKTIDLNSKSILALETTGI